MKKGSRPTFQFTIIDNNQSTRVENYNDNQKFFYPNPADKSIYLHESADITISDINGRILKHSYNTSTIDVSDLSVGVYFIKSSSGQFGRLLINR
jgi:hypothetical protein